MVHHVRTNNNWKRDKGKRGNRDFRWFGLWPTSMRQSLFFGYIFPWLFDCIQDSIYREIVWTLQIVSTSTLTTINLIYHLVTFVSWVLATLISLELVTLVCWVLVTLVSIRSCKPNGRSRTLRFDLEHQRARKKWLLWPELEHRFLWPKLGLRQFWPTSTTMVRTCTSIILACIGYYGRNLDIDNFDQKWLLWSKPKKKEGIGSNIGVSL